MDGVQALIFEAGRRPATYLANSAWTPSMHDEFPALSGESAASSLFGESEVQSMSATASEVTTKGGIEMRLLLLLLLLMLMVDNQFVDSACSRKMAANASHQNYDL